MYVGLQPCDGVQSRLSAHGSHIETFNWIKRKWSKVVCSPFIISVWQRRGNIKSKLKRGQNIE